jgi:hypothetical protein
MFTVIYNCNRFMRLLTLYIQARTQGYGYPPTKLHRVYP